jgi:sigma-B regulation protein RsbU (phosphoserine phosphatase)
LWLSRGQRMAEAERVRVLVADDQRFWRERVEEVLVPAGFEVECADSGEAAWEVLQRDPEIAILLTDWEMPGLSGVELCRRVRSSTREFYLPILLLTSRSSAEDLVEALDAGADAFLSKPFEAAELVAQLRVAERVLRLEAKLESRIQELSIAKGRIEHELAHAAGVQRALLPATPPDVPGVDFAWLYEPSAQLGGDVFNVFPLDERNVGIYVLDVSGHGTSAALHSVSLTHVLRPLPEQGSLLRRPRPGGTWEIPRPARVAAELNRRFPLMEISGHYFTFLYGVLDLETLLFRYSRAGHLPPIRIAGGGAHLCDGGGDLPVGVTADARYRDFELSLEPGDSLVLLTDGVPETSNEAGEEFGTQRMLDALGGDAERGIQRTVHGLGLALEEFRKLEPQRDDVTVVGLRVAR